MGEYCKNCANMADDLADARAEVEQLTRELAVAKNGGGK
jgi:hypothetical protein